MAEEAKTGLLDLEKELSCSICTEILYQPLTLLDCLHTFCGSCLKLWFSWQAQQASSRRSNPYTCPSCRATVRGTRPHAQITTLLDMYLQANPAKGKTAEEKEDIAKKYTPGENVISKPVTRGPTTEQNRAMEEVAAMSLQEPRTRRHGTYERGTNHTTSSRDRRREQSDTDAAASSPRRHIEHQSSLRSMISSSDADSSEIVDEILRQITEDGLLDGVNLEDMNMAQVEEVSERIANAYRERHPDRVTEAQRAHQRREHGSSSSRQASRSTGRHHSRSASAADQTQGTSSRPPVARPRLLEADTTSSYRRRTSSESRSRATTSRSPGGTRVREQAARSATDLSDRPQSSGRRDRRPSDAPAQTRRATDPRPEGSSHGGRRRSSGNSARSRPSLNSPGQPDDASGLIPVSSPPPEAARRTPFAELPDTGRPATDSQACGSTHDPPTTRSGLFMEPSITCDRCSKHNIQYDLHENCGICHDGQFSLCHRCYRSGAGCLNWFGFGRAAWMRFQTKAPGSPNPPHALTGRCYRRPRTETVQSVQVGVGIDNERRMRTTEDPATRLQSGAFCAICHAYADDCYWKCEACNDGEWGYCNTCVNQGRCCTHPLLPLTSAEHSASSPPASPPSSSHRSNRHSASSFTALTSPSLVQSVPYPNLANVRPFRPLTFTVHCDICHLAIAPTAPRHHCFHCSDGDYDVCMGCYKSLVEKCRITPENGEAGWRRCLQGHRMVMVVFEDTAMGQRRVVCRDLVGGVFFKEPGSTDVEGTSGSAVTGSGTGPNGGPGAIAHAHATASLVPPGVSPGVSPLSETEFSWVENGERKTRRVKRDLSPRLRAGMPSSSPDTSPRLNSSGSDGGAWSGQNHNAPITAEVSATLGAPAAADRPHPPVYPPDGGVGARLIARWAWLPAEGVADELAFPRGAEIREALDISREWAVGTYAGATGVFPSGYVMRL